MTSISNNFDKLIQYVSGGDETETVKKTPSKIKIEIGKNQKEKKSERSTVDYRMGPREGNTRIVGAENISTKITSGRTSLSGLVSNMNQNPALASPDGYFGSSIQGRRGDCYLLAEINAIRHTDHGQEILNKNVKANDDGSITVTLPGAVAIRNQYIKEGKGAKCEITGVYHITASAVAKARSQAGKAYSKGDIEIIALEIAMENYHAEMVKTKQNLE